MKWIECEKLISEDLSRLIEKKTIFTIVKHLLTNASFKITLGLRVGNYLSSKKNIIAKLLLICVALIHKHNQFKTGIQIAIGTDVGRGLVFPHYSCIVINKGSKIGKCCTIYHGVTIGSVRGGGVPQIGDNVVLSAHAQVIGNINIGNNVMIGAGAVVVSDIPDNAVAVGNPAKVINYNGPEKIKYYI